jgi:N-acetylmuramic acid 6-phosphate etherase
MKKTTEASSLYEGLDKMSTFDLLSNINKEDKTVPFAIEKELNKIESFVNAAFEKMKLGGKLFYLGAGTSGRLGIVDASECPPTYGVPFDLVNGIIAGGDGAIRKAVEFAEDDKSQGWKDLVTSGMNSGDVLVGIAASGTTPYVLGAIEEANKNDILTCGLSCNEDSPLSKIAQYDITPIVGPEFVTGSTRMKAGTAQKLILNMISTSLMIKLGRVQGNKMVDMQLSNLKLVDRGAKMVQEQTGVSYEVAKDLLLEKGSVRAAVNYYLNSNEN